MKTNLFSSLLFLFISLTLLDCKELNSDSSLSCEEPNPNEPHEVCNDVISSEALIIGKTWKSKVKDNEFSLAFKENDQFIYTAKKEEIHIEDSYLLKSESYKIVINGFACSQSGTYSYSLVFFPEGGSQIFFKEEMDECADRKNMLLSNNWKR